MSLTVEHHRTERLVARRWIVSATMDVQDGRVKYTQINGIGDNPISVDITRLRAMGDVIVEILGEVDAAKKRTRIPREGK